MSYAKLLDLMDAVPEDERELISGSYTYNGSYCIIGLCCPSSRECPPTYFGTLDVDQRNEIEVDMAALGLTVRDVEDLQNINDTPIPGASHMSVEETRKQRWQNVYNFVQAEASKE